MPQSLYLSAVRADPAAPPPEDAYFSALPAVRQLLASEAGLALTQPVTFFVGENGSGKSTLLEAIAVAAGFNPEGGTANFNFASRNTHSGLYQHLRLARRRREKDGFFLRAESFYNVATEVDRLYEQDGVPSFYGGKSLHHQSHGESFMSLVLSRFRGGGLYLLDEPEAALSPSRQMALLAAIDGLVNKESQFLISTHSPILMAYPNADIYLLGDAGLAKTRYEDTEHYTVTKRFIENPARMMRYLFEEEDS